MCLHAKSTILVTKILSTSETVKFLAQYVDTSLFKEKLTPCAKSTLTRLCQMNALSKT